MPVHEALEVGDVSHAALRYVFDGAKVGLGTGRAARAFVDALGRRVADGLSIVGVPTSQATEVQARALGIRLATLDEVDELDVCVDGADEVDPDLNLVKGLGGALVREKIVAAASRKLVILAGVEKLVKVLGAMQHVLPIEVAPFAAAFCERRLARLGLDPVLRRTGGAPLVTDNGFYILDATVDAVDKPHELEAAIKAIPGVLGTGLFLDMADAALIQDGPNIRVFSRRIGAN